MKEIWKPVVGWEGVYEVSSFGRVKRVKDHVKHLKPVKIGHGYYAVRLSCNERRAKPYIHTLVLEAFIGPRPLNCEGDHFDFDPSNNRLSNLSWCPREINRKRKRYRPETYGKFTHKQINEIRASSEHWSVIASRYGMSRANVFLIRGGKTWHTS